MSLFWRVSLSSKTAAILTKSLFFRAFPRNALAFNDTKRQILSFDVLTQC